MCVQTSIWLWLCICKDVNILHDLSLFKLWRQGKTKKGCPAFYQNRAAILCPLTHVLACPGSESCRLPCHVRSELCAKHEALSKGYSSHLNLYDRFFWLLHLLSLRLLMQVHKQVLIRRVNQVYFIRYDSMIECIQMSGSKTRQLATEGKHGQTCSYHSLPVKYRKILLASIFASGEAVSAWRASLNLRFALLWAATFSMS